MNDSPNYMPELSPGDKDQIERLRNTAESFLNQIKAQEQEIANIKERIKNMREILSDSVAGLIENMPPDVQKSAATIMYWHVDDPAVRRGIATGLGLNPRTPLSPHVYAAFYTLTCQCGAEYHHPIQSLTERGYQPPAECEACRQKRADEYNRRVNADRAAQAQALQALKSMPYAQYLKTDHWQELRKRALKRSNYRCQACNTQGVLHVHHRTYIRRGEELPTDLIVLCADCHETFHNKREVVNE